MRIAFILNDLIANSGVGRVVINLAEVMKKHGHKIQILTVNCDYEFIKNYEIKESEVITCKQLIKLDKMTKIPILGFLLQVIKYILFGILLVRKISKNKPSIINSHYYFCGISGIILSRFTHIPHILTIHGIRLSKANMKTIHYWVDYFILNIIKNRISHLILVDPNIKDTQQFRRISDQIEIIFPCLDERYIQLLRKIKPINPDIDRLKLIYIGRLEKYKGLEELLINLADNKSYWSELKIVGSGSYEVKLENLSKKLAISNKVAFSGFLDGIEKVKSINHADILISYSRSEGFPLVILEFFALGKPCIINPVGGITYFRSKFENEKLGIFLKFDRNFLKKILKPTYISEYFTQTTLKSRKHFIRNFTPEIIAKKYLDCFRRILVECV